MNIKNLESYRRSYKTYCKSNGEWEYFYTPEDAGVSDISYGDIKEDKNGDYIELPWCTYSDYSGCTVERSNNRCIIDDFKQHLGKGMYQVYGGYGTSAILVSVEFFEGNEELQDIIEELFDYPLVSEDDHSQLENEIEDEDWDSYRKDDLMRLLDEAGIEYNENTLYGDFRDVQDRIGEYTIFEDAVSSYVDLEKIVEFWDME